MWEIGYLVRFTFGIVALAIDTIGITLCKFANVSYAIVEWIFVGNRTSDQPE